jgi:4-hydroxy-tetrahydrodipicolinate reductase
MNLLIHGYGKMGKLVHQQAKLNPNINPITIIDPKDPKATHTSITQANLDKIDTIIDFSHSTAFIQLFQHISKNKPNIRITTGTSGWNEQEKTIKQTVKKQKLHLLYGANFSIGTAIFMNIVNYAAKQLSHFDTYDVSLLDIHHRQKPDMPSGTAKKIATDILQNFPSKTEILYGNNDQPIKPNQLHVNCLRLGENKGFHEVIFDSASDHINISQQTRDRTAYAQGSLTAALWLHHQPKPGYYTFNHCLQKLLTKTK